MLYRFRQRRRLLKKKSVKTHTAVLTILSSIKRTEQIYKFWRTDPCPTPFRVSVLRLIPWASKVFIMYHSDHREMEMKMQTVTITNRETGESFQAKVRNQAEYEGLSEWDKFRIVEVEMMEQLRDIGYNCSVKKVGSPAIFEWLCTVLVAAVFEVGNQT